MVFSGLVNAWRFAGWAKRRSPSSGKDKIEGVVRMPSAFSMTFGVLPSITATHELVVPRSIPMTLPMFSLPLFCGRSVGPLSAPEAGNSARPAGPFSDPLNTNRCRPLRRLGSYRRAGFPRKTYDHGFASPRRRPAGETHLITDIDHRR